MALNLSAPKPLKPKSQNTKLIKREAEPTEHRTVPSALAYTTQRNSLNSSGSRFC